MKVPNLPKHEIVKELVDAHQSAGHSINFWVTSNSMHPFLQVGDSVVAESTSPDAIRPGDVLVLRREQDYLTHRLIAKSEKKWLTKGDNNVLPDAPFSTKEIIGKVFQIQRFDKVIDLQIRKRLILNRLISRLSYFEWKAFTIQRYLRLPFRLAIKIIQKTFLNE